MKAAGLGQACTSAGFCKRLQQEILRRRSLDPRSNDLDTMTSAHARQAPLEGRIKIGDNDKNGFGADQLLTALPEPAPRRPASGKELVPKLLHFHLPELWQIHLPPTRGIERFSAKP